MNSGQCEGSLGRETGSLGEKGNKTKHWLLFPKYYPVFHFQEAAINTLNAAEKLRRAYLKIFRFLSISEWQKKQKNTFYGGWINVEARLIEVKGVKEILLSHTLTLLCNLFHLVSLPWRWKRQYKAMFLCLFLPIFCRIKDNNIQTIPRPKKRIQTLHGKEYKLFRVVVRW